MLTRKILLSACAVLALNAAAPAFAAQTADQIAAEQALAAEKYNSNGDIYTDFVESYDKPIDRYEGKAPNDNIDFINPLEQPSYQKPGQAYRGANKYVPAPARTDGNAYVPGRSSASMAASAPAESVGHADGGNYMDKGYSLSVRPGEQVEPLPMDPAAMNPAPAPAPVAMDPAPMAPQQTADIMFVPTEPAPAPAPQAAPMPPVASAYPDFVTMGCPTFDVHPEMKSITFFKNNDPRQLIASSSIKDVRGSCTTSADGLDLDLDLVMDAQIGAAGRYQTDPKAEELQSYPYFIALIDRAGNVQFKKIYAAIIRFPAGGSTTTQIERVRQFIPLPQGTTAQDFTLSMGYQLNPDQLNYNRGMSTSSAAPMAPAPMPARTAAVTPAPGMAPVMDEAPARGAIPSMVPVAPAAAEAQTAAVPMPAQAAAPAYTPAYTAPAYDTASAAPSNTPRVGHFLSNRPRVSQNPLAE